MGEFVPADVGNLGALPVEAGLLVLHVTEANPVAVRRERPFEARDVRLGPKMRIDRE